MSICKQCGYEHTTNPEAPKLIHEWLADESPSSLEEVAKQSGVNVADLAFFIEGGKRRVSEGGFVSSSDLDALAISTLHFGYWLATRGPKN
ncbi:hypothetical protein LCGC14_2306180 [marine sediment metagenome]|uniref:Uncharacterized protein n=1 Tax=marine sediment metagenome TaxID=412755 RepID=A0A0F9FGZ2_9ZZZZ